MAVRVEHQAEPIPGYRLIERLGGGGFGEVWKAEAPGGLFKAIKFVFGDLNSLSEDGHRAEQELKALSRVKSVHHPYILSLERYDIIEGRLMIVMELADNTLSDRFRDCRTQGLPGIPREELLNYLQETAEALDLMNIQYQLQHLDIKPQNLFLVHNHIKVADFGLVKDLEGMMASVTGGVTPGYAAPETFDGWVSRFCDQYSLAIVYQEMLTGVRPFSGTSVRQLVLQHMQAKPDLTPLPAHDQAAIARALSKNPDERYPTCQEFARALRTAAEQTLVPGAALPEAPEIIEVQELLPTLPPGHAEEATPDEVSDDEKTQRGPQQKKAKPASPPPLPLLPGAQTPPLAPRQKATPPPLPGAFPLTPPATPKLQPKLANDRKAVAKMHAEGVLLPSLVIGLGHLGLRTLKEFRRETYERFGSVEALPNVRLLHLDTDPETTQAATRGDPQAALRSSEVLLARLHRPSHYLKPGAGQGIDTWLNPKMLYRMSRQQTASGLRALGRLAFVDNYPTILRRLEQELRACCAPEGLQRAMEHTGLAVRAEVPRVYLVSSLAGGTGSGMFIDLAFAVRHILKKLGHETAEVIGLGLVPAADPDPRRGAELANAFAALTELNHYAGPDSVFEARYPLESNAAPRPFLTTGPPLQRCLLLPLPEDKPGANRSDSDDGTPPLTQGVTAVLSRAGHYLFADLTTPLGKTADQFRQQHALLRAAQVWPTHGEGPTSPHSMIFQTVGMYRLLWPRRLLLDIAARGLCQRLVQRWMTKDAKPLREQVKIWVAQQWAEFGLSQEQLIGRIQQACQEALRKAPEEVFATLILPLNNMLSSVPRGKAAVAPEPALQLGAVVEAMEQFENLLGIPEENRSAPKPGTVPTNQPGSLEMVLREAVAKMAESFEQKINQLVVRLIEAPEARLAGAEEAIRQLNLLTEQALQHHESLSKELQERASSVYERIQNLVEQPGTSPNQSNWKAPFTRRVPSPNSSIGRELLDLLRSYPKFRYQSLVLQQVSGLYVALRGLLSDHLREVDFCRARLTELLQMFDADRARTTVPQRQLTIAGRWLLPAGCDTLEDAVKQLGSQITPEILRSLDQRTQELLRKQFRALVEVCMGSATVLRTLMPAMHQEACHFLGDYLEDANIAEVYLQQKAQEEQGHFLLTPELQEDLQAAYAKASPELAGSTPDGELCLLAIPPGAGTQAFRQLVHEALPTTQWSAVPGHEDIVFYREQSHRSLSAFKQFGPLAQEAYQRLSALEHATPHTRTDTDWQVAATRH